VRFPAPVPVNSRVRARVVAGAVEQAADAIQVTWQVTVEREGGSKPCCVAEWLVRYYPL
jgi:acyl dehydratase